MSNRIELILDDQVFFKAKQELQGLYLKKDFNNRCASFY